jgi:aspartate/methionine/tyrosine aminotransferase
VTEGRQNCGECSVDDHPPHARHLTEDSTALCNELLAVAGLALAPGADFDSEQGRRFVRLSFAGTHAQVAAGAERLASWLRAR